MITEKDLQEAIAECQGERNPNANTCIKLAAYYTILNNLQTMSEPVQGYSYAPAPIIDPTEYVDYRKDTELSRLIDGKAALPVWEIVDELLQALQMLMPPLYNGTMQKIRNKVQ